MNTNIDHNRLIDSRNEDIFKKINTRFQVSFQPSYNGEHSMYAIKDQMTFYIPIGVYSVDSFTHELLHGWIDYHDVRIGSNFKLTMWQSNILKQIFDEPLAEHIANCIAHKLMLPIYLERGLNRSLFLLDYDIFKSEPGFLKQIERYYKSGIQYNLSAIRNFIGKYFAFTCDPNPDFDYSAELRHLKKIDPQLYMLLEQYLSKWSDYDFTSDEFGAFRQKNDWLYQHLKPWLSGKRFN